MPKPGETKCPRCGKTIEVVVRVPTDKSQKRLGEDLIVEGEVRRCLPDHLKKDVDVTYRASAELRYIEVKPKKFIEPKYFNQLLAVLHSNFHPVEYVPAGKETHLRIPIAAKRMR